MEDKEESKTSLLKNGSFKEESSLEHVATKENEFMELNKSCIDNHIGIFYGSLSAVATATTAVLSKKLSSTQTAGQTATGRYFVQLILSLLIILILRKDFIIVRSELLYVIARGVTQITAFIAMCWAYIYIPYDCTSVVLFGLLAIFSSVLARIFLKEVQTYCDYTIMMVILSGVVISAQPGIIFNLHALASSRYDTIKGVSYAVISSFLAAIGSCANRKITQTDTFIMVLVSSVFGLFIGSFYMLVTMKFWSSAMPISDIIVCVLLGIASTIGNFLWTRGLQLSNVAELMMAVQLEIPFGVCLEFIILQALPNISVIMGSILVVFGVCLKVSKVHVMRSVQFILRN